MMQAIGSVRVVCVCVAVFACIYLSAPLLAPLVCLVVLVCVGWSDDGGTLCVYMCV